MSGREKAQRDALTEVCSTWSNKRTGRFNLYNSKQIIGIL